ncbi:MAG TPA: hypothetical protein VK456_01440 [Xanthobacteraceae bacterium]|nr:hypothetical protein [Xanthobacteraceae bacterium]
MIGVEALRRIGASCALGVVAAFATGALGAVLIIRGAEYCGGIPLGNVPLQQAWTIDNASAIVEAWHRGRCECKAANQVWLDYLFILAYASLLFFIGLTGERAAARRGMSRLAFVAGLSACGGLLAGLFDCLENVGLLVMILHGPMPVVPFLTSVCSSLKFMLTSFSAIVGLIVLAAVLIHWSRQRRAHA